MALFLGKLYHPVLVQFQQLVEVCEQQLKYTPGVHKNKESLPPTGKR